MNKIIHSRNKNQHPHIFSRGTLELTFKLLRNHHPSLALAVQNVLTAGDTADQIRPATAHSPPIHQRSSEQLPIDLEAHTIGKIVAALTELGQDALRDRENNREKKSGKLVLLRTLICDWASLTEWIIMQAEPVPTTYH